MNRDLKIANITNRLLTFSVFQGKDNPISNFVPCEIKVFDEEHRLAKHAYQLTKALRSGNLDVAEKVRNAPTALDAKNGGKKYR